MKTQTITASAVAVLLFSAGITLQVWMGPGSIENDNVKQKQRLADDSGVSSVNSQPGEGSNLKTPQSLITHIEPSQSGEVENDSYAFMDQERIEEVKDRLLADQEETRERHTAHIAALETKYMEQSYNADWAPMFEGQLISAFDESGLGHATVTDVSCRSDSCIIDISSEQKTEMGMAVFQSETSEWLMANTSECESFTVQQTALDNDTGAESSQRVFLQGCV